MQEAKKKIVAEREGNEEESDNRPINLGIVVSALEKTIEQYKDTNDFKFELLTNFFQAQFQVWGGKVVDVEASRIRAKRKFLRDEIRAAFSAYFNVLLSTDAASRATKILQAINALYTVLLKADDWALQGYYQFIIAFISNFSDWKSYEV